MTNGRRKETWSATEHRCKGNVVAVNGNQSHCVEALVLTQQEAAALLKVAPRQLIRMGVPRLDLGRKTKRYVRKDVLAWLDAQRQDDQGRHVAKVPLT